MAKDENARSVLYVRPDTKELYQDFRRALIDIDVKGQQIGLAFVKKFIQFNKNKLKPEETKFFDNLVKSVKS